MPAITALAISAAAPIGRALAALGVRAACSVKRIACRLQNRRAAIGLAGLDDRMLADIGLTRSDLRDAYAEPLWHDPTEVLARRAAERRRGLRQAPLDRGAGSQPVRMPVVAPQPCCRAPAEQSSCAL